MSDKSDIEYMIRGARSSLVRRLQEYDGFNDDCVNEAADAIEQLLVTIQEAADMFDGTHDSAVQCVQILYGVLVEFNQE